MAKPHNGHFKPGQSGNPAGRPKGSRNKAAIVRAQHSVDDAMPRVVRMLCAIADRDPDALAEYGLAMKDVTVKQMLDAAKQLKDMGWVKNVVLDGDQKKGEDKTPDVPTANKPTFQSVAKIQKNA